MTRLMLASVIGLIVLAGIGRWLWTPDLNVDRLRQTYALSPSLFVEVLGMRLHVRDTGPRDAPALLMLHGFGSSLQTWDAWAQTLQVDHRVIRLDLPGSGLTGGDPTGDYSDERSRRLITALLDQLSVARVSLIGNSIGGRLAWKFAAEEPSRVEKLVLISPDGFASPGFEYGRAPAVPRALTLMRFILPRFLVKMNLASAFANRRALNEALVDRYYDLLRAPGVRAAQIERLRQTVLVDPVPLLRAIRTPTLLLWGRKDALIPFSNAEDYLRALPNATLVALDDLGHVPQEEDPARSIQPLRKFLER